MDRHTDRQAGRQAGTYILHKIAFTQRPFTDRRFYTEQLCAQRLLQADAFTKQLLQYTEQIYTEQLHSEAFTQSSCTHKLLQTSFYKQAFAHRLFYTQNRPHKATVTHRDNLLQRKTCTEKSFTHRSMYTQTLFRKAALAQDSLAFTHRCFYTKQLL